MRFCRERPLCLSTACAIFICAALHAAPVTNWHTFRAAPATTLSGQGTSSPVFGSTNLTANQAFLIGYFEALSLTNAGDRITLSFQATFTDAGGIANGDDQFRFALYDMNGQPRVTAGNTASAGVAGFTDNWRGYWFGIDSVQAVAAAGTIRERTSANLHPIANAGTALIGRPTGGEIAFQSSTDAAGGPIYFGEMALERMPVGIALAGFFGGNGATNLFAVNDATPSGVNYGAVGYLDGNNMSCDQINFQNVSIAYSPSNALQITSQPANVSVIAGQPAQFSVSWSGSGLIPHIQWRENGSDIPGATNATHAIAAPSPDQHGHAFSVVISNIFGDSVGSSSATLTVINDTNPPVVLSASSLVSNVINVIFSEAVDPITAQDGSSYSLLNNSISSISLIGNTNVQLTLDNPITETNYAVLVQNVRDLSGNVVAATNVAGIAHGFQGSDGILISDGFGFAFNDKLIVHAGGADIFGTSDQFQYVYRPTSGDFDVAVRVESLREIDNSTKAGLMARVNTFYDSRNVMVAVTPLQFVFQYRTNSGLLTTASPPRPAGAFPNCWVRLKRTGSVISGYSRADVGAWTLMDTVDTANSTDGPYPTDILVGLAVSSHDVDEVTQAVFSDFGPVTGTPSLMIARIGNAIELSWPPSALGFDLQAAPNLPSIAWTNVPGSHATNRMQISAGSGTLFFRLSN